MTAKSFAVRAAACALFASAAIFAAAEPSFAADDAMKSDAMKGGK